MGFDQWKRRLRAALWGGSVATGESAPLAQLPIGASGVLRLPKPEVASDHLLILRVEPSAPYCWVTVDVNGVRRQRLVLSLRAVFSCSVDWSLLEGAPEVEIKLDTSESIDIAAGSLLSVFAVSLQPIAPSLPSSLDRAREAPPSADPPKSNTELLGHFVSFGENCEFGLYQRKHGVDASSLLRLAAVDFEGLTRGLQERFAACHDPAELVLEMLQYADGRREYIRKLERYEIHWHTLVDEGQVDGVEMFVREHHKLVSLLRKLVDTLAAGDRIIVYKRHAGLDAAQRRRLARLLAPYGRNGLLIVVPAPSKSEIGKLVLAEDGVMIGYIDKFLPLDAANGRASNVWTTLCRNAFDCWRRQCAASSTVASRGPQSGPPSCETAPPP